MAATKDPTPNKDDVLQAQINVSISQARNLVSSWFPPSSALEIKHESSQLTSNSEIMDDFDFKPVPPGLRLGLGAPIPKGYLEEGSQTGKDLLTDQLRRKMLGISSSKRFVDGTSASSQCRSTFNNATVRRNHHNKNGTKHGPVDSESEEEAGRSGLGKLKRRKLEEKEQEAEGGKAEANEKEEAEEEEEYLTTITSASTGTAIGGNQKSTLQSSQRRYGSFLDAHNAEKSGKRKKKKKKRNKATNGD